MKEKVIHECKLYSNKQLIITYSREEEKMKLLMRDLREM